MERSVHADLWETAHQVGPLVEELLRVKEFTEIPGLMQHLEFFPAKRRRRQLLKPHLVRCGYELGGGENWQDVLPVCAAAEFLNVATYQSNAAFDSKYGSQDAPGQFISSALVRERAGQIISEVARRNSSVVVDQLLALISESVARVYLAQFLDLYVLRVPAFDLSAIDRSKFDFLYDLRCRHGSGFLIATCLALGFKLANGCEDDFQNVFGFGLEYGTGLHIVNDMADYVPPWRGTIDTHKGHQDAFSDLREGKVTLPFVTLLSRVSLEHRDSLARCLGSNPDPKTVGWIFDLGVSSGAFVECRQNVKQYYKSAKKLLHKIPKSPARDRLATIAATLRSNKYFHTMRTAQVEDEHAKVAT